MTVQIATSRAGVPHARSFARWANAAFAGGRARRSRRSAELTIRVIGAAESRRLNRTWRGKNKPTNVLSFQGAGTGNRENGTFSGRGGRVQSRFPGFPSRHHLGDLAICAPVVAREAREQGKPPAAHWAHMVVHGMMHLLGYDHENDRDAAQMEAREVKILAQLGVPNPYG